MGGQSRVSSPCRPAGAEHTSQGCAPLSVASRPCFRRTPTCSDHSQPPLTEILTHAAVVSGLLPVAAVGRHAGVALASGIILPLQTRRPWGRMPQSRTIATPVAAPCTWVESKGDAGIVVYYGRGGSGDAAALYGPCDVLRMWTPCRASAALCRHRRSPCVSRRRRQTGEGRRAPAARSAILSPWQGWVTPLLALRSCRSLSRRGPLFSIVIPTPSPSRKPRYHA